MAEGAATPWAVSPLGADLRCPDFIGHTVALYPSSQASRIRLSKPTFSVLLSEFRLGALASEGRSGATVYAGLRRSEINIPPILSPVLTSLPNQSGTIFST